MSQPKVDTFTIKNHFLRYKLNFISIYYDD